MLIYINRWKLGVTENFTYKINMIIGGEKMYRKKLEQPVLGKSKEMILYPKTIQLNILDNLIQTKIKNYVDYAKLNTDLLSKAKWLSKWNNTTKKEILSSISIAIVTRNVSDEKLINLNDLVQRYYQYFDVIDSEDDIESRFEETFDTLLQIPDEVFYYLEVKSNIGNPKFVSNDKYNNRSRRISVNIKTKDDDKDVRYDMIA